VFSVLEIHRLRPTVAETHVSLQRSFMFGTIVLVIATLFFLYTAWSSGIAPVEFAERLGLAAANAGGYNEIRAQYAGFSS